MRRVLQRVSITVLTRTFIIRTLRDCGKTVNNYFRDKKWAVERRPTHSALFAAVRRGETGIAGKVLPMSSKIILRRL